jgi:aspartokinase/homoserine dehydrogenase 1
MRILKFGGSSVASPDAIRRVIDIVLEARSRHGPLAVVVSAFGGVTDALLHLGELALAGQATYAEALAEIGRRHLSIVAEMVEADRRPEALARVQEMLTQLDDVCRGIALVGERTPKTTDFIVSFGERLSACIVCDILRAQAPDAAYLDARQVVRTDAQFGAARVDFARTDALIADYLRRHPGLPVITGFIGSNGEGATTTLGRSGSDYTAAIFGAALDAEAIEIWTDVNGLMTADPRQVRQAFSLERLSYVEAMELSYFGAKVIFPATMQPAMVKNIPILIKNTFNPAFPGTVISRQSDPGGMTVKGISSLSGIALLNVQGSNMVGVVGISHRLFAALAQAGVNVILISQASSEHSICLAVTERSAAAASEAIEAAFELEIGRGWIDPVETVRGQAIVAIVGENMRRMPGVAAKMFTALGKNGINVAAIAQGSSELNLSAVIEEKDLSKALNALHEGLFLSDRRTVNLFVAGTGLIGHELLGIIERQQAYLAGDHRIYLNLVGLTNRRRMKFWSGDGLAAGCRAQLDAEGEEADLSAFVDRMRAANLPNSVFVDATASADLVDCYEPILAANISIVTPNKLANSGPMQRYRRLRRMAARSNVQFRYETNVCAGLPVIGVLQDLLHSGDRVIRLEAVLSGTLNYLLSEYDGSRPFSAMVAQAMEKGFTEPDPRDDLNGLDVARKILILARECGSEEELSAVKLESIVPAAFFEAGSRQAFLQGLIAFDPAFDARYCEAADRGRKLRYIGRYEAGALSVGLEEVGPDHPFFALQGTENCVSLTTDYYRTYPMVIKGPGAGAAVTAAGVFAEIVRLSV